MTPSLKESFYICPECGALTTRSQIDSDRENGGDGRCSCRYTDLLWNHKKKTFECVHTGLMIDWTEIPWTIYERLSDVPRGALRLRSFESYIRATGGKQDAN
jgi:hypothetical protein